MNTTDIMTRELGGVGPQDLVQEAFSFVDGLGAGFCPCYDAKQVGGITARRHVMRPSERSLAEALRRISGSSIPRGD